MKDRLLQLAGGLALVAVIGKFYAVPLMAQVRAVLVKNLDERGRVPYTAQVNCTATGFGNTNECIGSFLPVPANRRFVLEYINGTVLANHANQFSGAFLDVPAVPQNSLSLTTHFEVTDVFHADTYSISMPVVLYFEPGQIAVVRMYSLTLGNNPIGGSITLSGYLVDLTQ